jgi:uncharacterized membrane protein YraQ (UPF0718 family)
MMNNLLRKIIGPVLISIIPLYIYLLIVNPFQITRFFGKCRGMQALIITTLCLYSYLSIFKPEAAKKSVRSSVEYFSKIILILIAALFIAGSIKHVIPQEVVARCLGEETGILAVFIGVAIGSILPACPLIFYPIVAGVYAAGAGLIGVLAILFGSGLAYACRICADLTFFNPKIAGLRLLLTFLTALLAGLLVYVMLRCLGMVIL